MRTHTKITTSTMDQLPRGGVLEIFREGKPDGLRPRFFTVQHSLSRQKEPYRFFHSKSTLPAVAVDYLCLCTRMIKPDLIILPGELNELWAELARSDAMGRGELAKIKVEVARG